MTKFGQAEYNDFMARIFADKLDKLLKESEKQNYINRNTEDIYKEFASSKDAELLEYLQWLSAQQQDKPTNVKTAQIRISNFIKYSDTIP